MSELLQQHLTQWTRTAGGSEAPTPEQKAARARLGVTVLRALIDTLWKQGMTSNQQTDILSAALNAVSDRCSTADALECLRDRGKR